MVGFKLLAGFLDDESGVVTVDWVAVTASVLLLGIMVVYAISNNGVSELVVEVNNTLGTKFVAVDIGTAESINQ